MMPRSRLSVTMALAALVCAGASHSQQAYKFVEIAATDGPIAPAIFSGISIDENGDVAFVGQIVGTDPGRRGYVGRGGEQVPEDYDFFVPAPLSVSKLHEFDNGRLAYLARESNDDVVGVATQADPGVIFSESELPDTPDYFAQILSSTYTLDATGSLIWSGRASANQDHPDVPPFTARDNEDEFFADRTSLFRDPASALRGDRTLFADGARGGCTTFRKVTIRYSF